MSFHPVLLQIMQLNCRQQASIGTWVNSSTFIRGSTFEFHYYSLGGDTAMPGGLYAGLCHAFLAESVILNPHVTCVLYS